MNHRLPRRSNSKLPLYPIKNFSFGITLIESLLVIGIAGVFLTLIVPALQTFNRNQTLKTTAINFKSNLRQAQDNAFSGRRNDKELGCPDGVTGGPPPPPYESLLGWYVFFSTTTPGQYELRGLCSGGTAFSGKDVKLPGGVTISEIRKISPAPQATPSPVYILFRTVTNDVGFYSAISSPYPGPEITATEFQITLSLGSSNYYLYIKNTGEIYESKP